MTFTSVIQEYSVLCCSGK